MFYSPIVLVCDFIVSFHNSLCHSVQLTIIFKFRYESRARQFCYFLYINIRMKRTCLTLQHILVGREWGGGGCYKYIEVNIVQRFLDIRVNKASSVSFISLIITEVKILLDMV